MTGKILSIVAAGALLAAPVWLASGAAAAQQGACLHGSDETPAERARRASAIGFTRAINTAQAHAWSRGGAYAPLENLQGLPKVPAGFDVQLAVDEDGYIFTVKDTLDPCRFVYLSDQVGLIYTGEPIR